MPRMTRYASGPPTTTLGTSERSDRRCASRAWVAPVAVVATARAILPAVASLTHGTSNRPATSPVTLPTSTAATNSTSSRANALASFTTGLRPRGQPDRERASFARRARDRNLAVLELGQQSRNGEAEACSAEGAAAGLIDAEETIEDPIEVLGCDPGAGVADADAHSTPVPLQRERDGASGRIAHGVRGEVQQDVPRPVAVSRRPHGAGRSETHCEIAILGHRLGDLADLLRHRGQVERPTHEGKLAVLDASDEQQFVQHLGGAVELPLHAHESLEDLGVGAAFGRRLLHLGTQMGQLGQQFVARVRRERLEGAMRAVDALEHPVDAVGELRHLRLAGRRGEALAELGRADGASLRRHALEWI